MAHAEKCPICEGSGRLPLPVEMGTTASRPYDKLCHGCGGKGWVEVADSPYYTIQPLGSVFNLGWVSDGAMTGDDLTSPLTSG